MTQVPVHIVGLGGTFRRGSTTERLVEYCLAEARARGAETQMFDGAMLALPLYKPGARLDDAGLQLITALRQADGIVIGAPGYHGSISGLMKNALDYIEELSGDTPAYLTGRAVLSIATAGGWQGACSALSALRSITHALRGWPTPLGIAVNVGDGAFDAISQQPNPSLAKKLAAGAEQLLAFARGDHRLKK